jgi:hypothetical protein
MEADQADESGLIRIHPCPTLFHLTVTSTNRRADRSVRNGCCERSGHGRPFWRKADRCRHVRYDLPRSSDHGRSHKKLIQWWLEAGVPQAKDRVG